MIQVFVYIVINDKIGTLIPSAEKKQLLHEMKTKQEC